MKKYYPAFLDVAQRKCIVIGGGEIADRKVSQLIQTNATVVVVSPSASTYIQDLADHGKITWIQRHYESGDLVGSFLTIAATDDPSVNQQVHDEAKQERILINVIDVPELCDFIAPATVERGQITVAISTGGASPALARKIKEAIEHSAELTWADTTQVVTNVRSELRKRKIPIDPDSWQRALDEEFRQLITSGDFESAKTRLLDTLVKSQEPL
jgi:precorrin-2 dehydrogenase/sirohydrochlorin ferrochelatase